MGMALLRPSRKGLSRISEIGEVRLGSREETKQRGPSLTLDCIDRRKLDSVDAAKLAFVDARKLLMPMTFARALVDVRGEEVTSAGRREAILDGPAVSPELLLVNPPAF